MDDVIPLCRHIYISMNLNIFSELRKPGLVPGKSLSLSTNINSVLEKKSNLHYVKHIEKSSYAKPILFRFH